MTTVNHLISVSLYLCFWFCQYIEGLNLNGVDKKIKGSGVIRVSVMKGKKLRQWGKGRTGSARQCDQDRPGSGSGMSTPEGRHRICRGSDWDSLDKYRGEIVNTVVEGCWGWCHTGRPRDMELFGVWEEDAEAGRVRWRWCAWRGEKMRRTERLSPSSASLASKSFQLFPLAKWLAL